MITTHTTTVLGEVRTYTVDTPSNFNPATGSVMIFLKGGGSSAKLAKTFTKALQKNNCIGIYPDAIKRGKGKANWALEGELMQKDIVFFNKIDSLHLNHPRKFLSGVSNGGCFALLMITLGYNIKATVTFAASAWEGMPTPLPKNLFAVHGIDDESVPYVGGYRHGITFKSAIESILLFAEQTEIPHVGHYPGATMTTYPGPTTAQLLSVEGIGHSVFTKYKGINLIDSMFQFFKNSL